MFRDNSLLLDTHYATTAINAALQCLQRPTYSESLSPTHPLPSLPRGSTINSQDQRVLDLLAIMCCCGTEAVPHNQNAIATSIFAPPPQGPPISTRLNPTGGIEILAPPASEKERDAEQWIDLAELSSQNPRGVKGLFNLASTPQKHIQTASWLISQLSLGALVCMGQNYKSIHLVERCHPWKEAFKALVQSTISFEISFVYIRNYTVFDLPQLRTAYCRLALHVFVDRYPQHHVAGSMTIAVRKIYLCYESDLCIT